jgi:3'-phosphoadenosine 5'-phosphosulfate sulfotransferase (PAPS reductase)/FAD synthetase
MYEKIGYHVLNLGAGVQSTALLFLAEEGRLRLDTAIFADTHEESTETYRHLWEVAGKVSTPILVTEMGSMGQAMMDSGFFIIPVHAGTGGVGKRQCTAEYKVKLIRETIRKAVLRLQPRERLKLGTIVHQYYGISADEARRARKITARMAPERKWTRPHFPLLDMGWTRADCVRYLDTKLPYAVQRSCCTFCPYRNNADWFHLKHTDPAGWARAVEIDRALKPNQFVHWKKQRLEDVALVGDRQLDGFVGECSGACGV